MIGEKEIDERQRGGNANRIEVGNQRKEGRK